MRRHYFLAKTNLDNLSVMKAEKLTRFSTRVKEEDAVAFILFARIWKIREHICCRLFVGTSDLLIFLANWGPCP